LVWRPADAWHCPGPGHLTEDRYEDDEPIYNTRFLAFATHYGFRPVACRRRRPQTKGKVERPFYFVETNLLSGREFRSLEHLNEVAAWWLREVADVRVHRQTRRRPIDLFAEELPHLIPLPERPYEVAEVVYRTVDAEGFVSYGQNRYSVPWQSIGQVLPLRITDDEVIIYGPRLEVLARHGRFPLTERHRQSRQAEHLPPRDVAQRRAALQERFAELGPVAVRFLEGLLGTQRCGWDQAQKVLALLGTYRREDLLAALERAVRYGAFSVKPVERILAVQARPKTALERMAEDKPSHLGELLSDDPMPPRPAAEYQHLLFEESDRHDDAQAIDRAQIEQLATGEFVRRGENLVMVGQSGVGKSFLLQALARRFCELGYRARYTTSAELLEDLRKSLADQSLPRRIRYWSRFDLVVIDEFGFDRIERGECPQAANLFYKVIDARSGKRSTALATNIDFEAWSEYLGDPPLAMAFLDRVVDGAILLKIRGKSYRAHRAKKPSGQSKHDSP